MNCNFLSGLCGNEGRILHQKKIHIKEFSLKIAMKDGMSKAFDMPIGQGDINWKRVREELAKIQFHGWATGEVRGGDRQRLAEISTQMDHVLYA